MQINIAPPGPPQMMEMSLFGRASPELNAFLQQRSQEVSYRLQNNYGTAGTLFMQQSQQFYQDFAVSSGVKAAESMILSGAATISTNLSENLVPLETYEQLQAAHSRYQPYLMANPVVRSYYLEERLEGYSETYENREGNNIGWDQVAYREVVSGMNRSSYDFSYISEEEEEWLTTTQDSLDGEPDLSFLEKVNVINAWHLQNKAIDENIDPTSVDGFKIREKS